MNAGNDKTEVAPAKKTGLSLFERVTGVALGEGAERKERATHTPPSDAVASETTEPSSLSQLLPAL